MKRGKMNDHFSSSKVLNRASEGGKKGARFREGSTCVLAPIVDEDDLEKADLMEPPILIREGVGVSRLTELLPAPLLSGDASWAETKSNCLNQSRSSV